MAAKLIADSGATKCEWCLLMDNKRKKIITQGISPYFLDAGQIIALLQKELLPKLRNVQVEEVHYYGTGLSNPNNVKLVKGALKKLFPGADVAATHDLMAAARSLCRNSKGIACITVVIMTAKRS
jgi:hypothetical protein